MHFPNAFKIAVRAAQMLELAGHGILDVLVFATPAFQDQPHLDLGLFPLLEMEDRRAGPEIIPAVLAGDGVHGVGAQLAAPGGFRNGFERLLADGDLVHADRSFDLESGHARVLADGAFVFMGHVDVLANDGQRLSRLGLGVLAAQRPRHGFPHIGGQIRGSLDDQFEHALFEKLHKLLRRGRARNRPKVAHELIISRTCYMKCRLPIGAGLGRNSRSRLMISKAF